MTRSFFLLMIGALALSLAAAGTVPIAAQGLVETLGANGDEVEEWLLVGGCEDPQGDSVGLVSSGRDYFNSLPDAIVCGSERTTWTLDEELQSDLVALDASGAELDRHPLIAITDVQLHGNGTSGKVVVSGSRINWHLPAGTESLRFEHESTWTNGAKESATLLWEDTYVIVGRQGTKVQLERWYAGPPQIEVNWRGWG